MGNVMLSLPPPGFADRMAEEPPTCFSCTLLLTETIHVKCFECSVSVCMLCFQCGAESPPHRRGHNYELIKPSEQRDGKLWTHADEFELLKNAHKFKMGNWGEISENSGRGRKHGQECKDYFEKHFIRGWIGQFSIKSAHWEKLKYSMYINQSLDSVLNKNCLESTERMLLIRDAVRASGESLDENDPRLAVKVQQILESHVQKCMDGDIEVKYERPKVLTNQFNTELTDDELDGDEEIEMKPRKLVKIEIPTDDSDLEDVPGPSCSYRPRNGAPVAKKRKTTRVVMESSSDSEEKSSDNDNSFHGLERETEDEDPNGSVFDSAHEFDTEDEEEQKPIRKGGASSTKRGKRKRNYMSKKDRRLQAFRNRMNREQKKGEKKLATLSNICSLEEVKELRAAYPRLLMESGARSSNFREREAENLSMLGYNVDREEFDTEWFNDAEQLISRLTITAAPAEKDQKLDIDNDIKFARLRQYIRILGIRKAKRNTILEHDKINEFFRFYKERLVNKKVKATDVLDSRSEKEKVLANAQQFLTRDEYQALVSCMERMDGMMERIETLQELQRNGDTNLKNAPPVHDNKKKKLRKIDVEQRKKMATEWTKYKKWHTSGWE